MKQYKLIKTYPNSPELGTIVTYYGNWNMYGITNECIFKADVIENSSEFWEKEVQKEYEILSFIDKPNTGRIYKKYTSNLFYSDDSAKLWYESELLKDEDVKIHSVKRICDGEVFTIGDKVINVTNEEITKIKEFSTEPKEKTLGKLCAFYEDGSFDYFYDIPKLEKSFPLFKTEDGVDIHVNQYSYGVYLPTMKFTGDYIWRYKDNFSSISLSKETKYFSTEEKAKEYIIMNKPCLSINDINFLKTEGFCFWDRKLKELVKSKI